MREVLKEWTSEKVELIHGNARGADKMAAEVAKELGWDVLAVPAEWDRYGRGAGHKRNQEMVKMKPDLCVAFWDGESRGTLDCISRAKSAGIKVRVVRDE